MSKFDEMYLSLCARILDHGVKTEGRNGTTLRVPGNHWIFNLEDEFPILTVKKVAWKSAILEMMWIYQVNSIDVSWLKERNIHIWDKFEIGEDGVYTNPDTNEKTCFGKDLAGTIGTSYGYIIANGGENDKKNQIEAAIDKIKNNPADRRIIICIWQPPFFYRAVLPPCVYKVQFLVLDGKLHSFVEQRSCDTFLGVPFNITQYATLTYMLAHTCGLKEHIEQVEEMLNRGKDILPAPKLWLNPEVKSFFDFDNSTELKDSQLIDYQHLGAIKGIVKA